MKFFWLIAGLLTAGALMFLAIPLLRANKKHASTKRSEINLDVYRDQMRELEADLAANTLSEAQYQKARNELEKRVLENTPLAEEAVVATSSDRWVIVAAVVAVPLLAVSIYLLLGKPDGTHPDKPAPDITQAQIEDMVVKLAQKLKDKPDDAQGWEMLGRSYATLRRFGDSKDAYARAAALEPDNARLLIDYADILAMTNGRIVAGEPEKIVQQALQIEPDNIKALALAGTAAFQRKDYKQAIELWQRILKLVPPDSQVAQAINANVSQAQGLSGQSLTASQIPAGQEAPASGGKAVSGRVSIDAALKPRIAATDTVFIFARDADVQRPPLAMVRKTVGDLPYNFELDDSMSVMPNFKLSSASSVIIGARISKSGNAAPQSGDLQGSSQPVRVGEKNVKIVINTEVR
ncbi:MAG: c-type cytochrome biogenesis protein CcmI [Gallionellaceae bacterium]